MKHWTEEEIEQFILDNRDKFPSCNLPDRHEDKFLRKLAERFKKIISIVPYLIRVAAATVIIFILSIWSWNLWIRKDRNEVTLKQKIENIIQFKK